MSSETKLKVLDTGRRTTVGFVNLGCSKNQVDSEIMLGSLDASGFQLTPEPSAAEVVIINTCGFIQEAKQESIEAIIEYGGLKQSGSCKVLIAAGCLAQRYQNELLDELPELDGVVGTGDVARIAEVCRALLKPEREAQRVWMSPPPYLYDELTPRLRLGRQHSAYVKLAEGCNRACAFCAIPIMRGKQRSRPIESIAAEIRSLVAQGVKEVNLISQDTMHYGLDLGLRKGLVALLRELVTIEGLRWIRPFYLYPQHVSDELISLYAGEEKIAKYVDMPLQHVNDALLKRMNRLGDKRYMSSLLERFRKRIPGLTFRTAFIVGFPGETKAAFAELKRFIREAEFERVAVFLYSDEEDTPAAGMSRKLDREIMEERRAELVQVQDAISLRKSRAKIGSTMEVMVEGPSEETELLLEGRHEGMAPEIDGVVYINDVASDPALPQEVSNLPAAGDFVKVEVTDASKYDLVGHVIGR